MSQARSPLPGHRQDIADMLKPTLETIEEALKQQGFEQEDDTPLSLALETVVKLLLSKYGATKTINLLENLILEINNSELSSSLAHDV